MTLRADKEFLYGRIRHVVIEKQAGKAKVTNAMKAETSYGTIEFADTIYAVVARCFGAPRKHLTGRTLLVEDLGVDSIDLLALAVDFEKEFDVVIPDQTLCRIRTIGDIGPCISSALESRQDSREAASVDQTIGESVAR